LDIAGEGRQIAIADIAVLYQKKTGAILGACCEMAALLADAPREAALKLRRIGINIGIGFQVRDDLLSITGTEADIGKTLSVDQTKGKSTSPKVLGIDAAERYAADILTETRDMISSLALPHPGLLLDAARMAVERNR